MNLRSLRRAALPALAAVAMIAISAAYAGLYNFPFASLTADTTARTAATLPMTGTECIPGDTNLSGGRAPQTACYTQGNLIGNYVTAITSVSSGSITWSAADNARLYTLQIGANHTLAAPTGLTSGQRFSLLVVQTNGSNTLTWPAAFGWPAQSAGGQPAAPTLTTTAARADLFEFVAGTKLWGTGLSSQNRVP